MTAAVFFVLWLVWMVVAISAWVWVIHDVIRTPEHAFRLAGRDKANWVLVAALCNVVGALVWRFGGARADVRRALDLSRYGPPLSATPAGWYPDPAGGPGFAWWDGRDWSGEHRSSPPRPNDPD